MLCAAGGPGGPCSFGMPAAKQRFAINDLIRTILLYRSVQYRVRMKINAKLGWFTKQHAGPNPVSGSIRLLLRIITSLLRHYNSITTTLLHIITIVFTNYNNVISVFYVFLQLFYIIITCYYDCYYIIITYYYCKNDLLLHIITVIMDPLLL